MIGSLVAPGLCTGHRHRPDVPAARHRDTDWYTSALGAQLSWTLPFGVLVMFAVMSPVRPVLGGGRRDLGAVPWQTSRLVVIPILLPASSPWRCSALPFHTTSSPAPADGGLQQHSAARDLEHDAERHFAVDLRARHLTTACLSSSSSSHSAPSH